LNSGMPSMTLDRGRRAGRSPLRRCSAVVRAKDIRRPTSRPRSISKTAKPPFQNLPAICSSSIACPANSDADYQQTKLTLQKELAGVSRPWSYSDAPVRIAQRRPRAKASAPRKAS